VGIEAASRGARDVYFFENHGPAVALIRKNLTSLGLIGGVTLFATDAVRGLEMLASRRVHADFVFVDPPYAAREEYERALEALDRLPLLAPGGRVIVEHSKRWWPAEQWDTLERERVVESGDSALSFYRLSIAA
jgi:16S rRNA (guanine(966)-N(2))-methyltransferase RsmD